MMTRAPLLAIGGGLSLVAALLHVAVILGGPDWYRFFGAGEAMAQADARGSWSPALMTIGIAIILSIWAAYAFSGAGLIRRLPLLRTGLVVISAIYLARGLLVFVPPAPGAELSHAFMLWSSLIVLIYGLFHAVGTWRAWPYLSQRTAF